MTDNFGYDDVEDPSQTDEELNELDEQQDQPIEDQSIGDQICEHAAQYIKLRLPIIPLCPPDHRGMTLTHRQTCKSPGKSPLMKNWSSRDTPTQEEVSKWFNPIRAYNIGLILGETSSWNIVGVDIDNQLGEDLLQQWSEGIVPTTWEYTTGKGRRLLYKLPQGMKSKKFRKGENKVGELALLACGQQTVLPPSVHVSGKQYLWVEGHSPDEIALALAPEWLTERVKDDNPGTMDLTQESARVTHDEWAQTLSKGSRNVQVARLAGSLLSKRHMTKEDTLIFLLQWNDRHCDPPLEKPEIEAMVESISASEQIKQNRRSAAKQNSAVRERMQPVVTAGNFIVTQSQAGFEWKYIAHEDAFYYCDRIAGPWRKCSDTEFARRIREQLLIENEDWGVQRNISEVEAALKEQLYDEPNDDIFDIGKHPDLDHIYCSNGTLDWTTGQLVPWDWKSFSTIRLPVIWDPQQSDNDGYQMWQKNLQDWIPDQTTRDFLQEFVGYSLLPDCSFRTSVFLYGHGVNGKSLFLEVVKLLFGEWLESLPIQRINEKFDTVALQNKLINICSDIDPKYMTDTGNLKLIIAGEDIRGEHKYGASYTFTPVSRLIFSANTLPKSIDKSEGWFSRWKIVTFPNKFAVNSVYKKNLMTTMSQPQSLSALLYWAVQGLKRLHQQGHFSESAAMSQDSIDYRNENDNVAAFVDNYLDTVPHTGTETQLVVNTLYGIYKEYCISTGAKPVGQIEFSKRIQSLGVDKATRPIKRKSTLVFLGLQFKDQPGDDFEAKDGYQLAEAIRVSSIKQRA